MVVLLNWNMHRATSEFHRVIGRLWYMCQNYVETSTSGGTDRMAPSGGCCGQLAGIAPALIQPYVLL
jgi:hypothetical protein